MQPGTKVTFLPRYIGDVFLSNFRSDRSFLRIARRYRAAHAIDVPQVEIDVGHEESPIGLFADADVLANEGQASTKRLYWSVRVSG